MATDQCRVCGKTSDGVRYVQHANANGDVTSRVCLCGTDFDAWLASPERVRDRTVDLVDFINRRQAERRNAR